MAVDYSKKPKDEQGDSSIEQLGPGQGGVIGTTDAGTGEQRQGGEGTSSGSYTNLQAYLDANSSRGFGQEVAGKVGSGLDSAREKQQQGQTEFLGQVDSSRVTPNESLYSRVGSDPVGLVGDEQAKSDFLRARDAEYKGPTDLSDSASLFGDVDGATQRAKQRADLSENIGGRKALLDEYYGAGKGRFNYSAGEKSLDNLLMQNDPNSRAAFTQVRNDADTFSNDYQDMLNYLSGYAGDAKTQTEAARSGARGALGIDDAGALIQGGQGAIQNTLGGVQDRYQQANALLQAIANQGESAFSDNTKAYLQGIGHDYGVDPTKYYAPEQFGLGDLASAQEKANYAALTELAGLPQDQFQNTEQGRLYGQDPYSFNNTGYEGAVGARKTEFNTGSAPKVASVKEAQDTLDSLRLDPSEVQGTEGVHYLKLGNDYYQMHPNVLYWYDEFNNRLSDLNNFRSNYDLNSINRV